MLLGQFEGRIDEKYRIGFPKKFRKYLGDELIVTRGFERSLIIVSEKNYRSLLEGTEGKPLTEKNSREVQRYLLGGASNVTLDAKGRFLLPEYLRRHALLTEDAVFLGIQRYVELWDKKTWLEHEKELADKIEGIAEKLSIDE